MLLLPVAGSRHASSAIHRALGLLENYATKHLHTDVQGVRECEQSLDHVAHAYKGLGSHETRNRTAETGYASYAGQTARLQDRMHGHRSRCARPCPSLHRSVNGLQNEDLAVDAPPIVFASAIVWTIFQCRRGWLALK